MWRSGFITIIFLGVTFFKLNAQSGIDHWEMVVKADHNWRYHVGTSAPSTTWHEPGFDPSAWSEGPGGFGYGDDDDATVINTTSSVYLRINFNILDLSQIEKAVLLCDYDDAFIAYLNGQEVGRNGVSGNPPGHDQYADVQHEALLYQGQYPEELVIGKNELSNYLMNGENSLAVQVHNINATSSDLSSNFYLAVGLNVDATIYETTTPWFREPLEFNSSNLPIIKITTTRSIPDEPKVLARMGIIDHGPGITNHIDDAFTGYDGNIGIEIRGSSSQMFPKKQYAVELWTDAGLDTSASVLGLPAEEDWILYAPYSDKSLLRNLLAYKFSRDLGWYAPRTRLVELYIDELYKGVYVFTEKIKRDVNRVNINKLNPDENSGDDLTGGYIVKIDKFDGATVGLGWDSPFPPRYRTNNQSIHFQFHYPKEDEITYEQANYIETYITNFEESLLGPLKNHPEYGYRAHINVESFIDFAIVNEITKNVDGYRLSTFLYKDKDSDDGKLYLGPVWDFNLGFGNANYCEGGTIHGWAWDFNKICGGDYWLVPFWWEKLMQDQEFKMQFKARWQEVRVGILSDENIMNYIDSVVTVLDRPQQRNFLQWPILSEYIWPNNYVGGSYSNEVLYLKDWIDSRLNWLDNQINAFELITSIDEQILPAHKINIYPNPGNGIFNIHFSKSFSEKLQISLHNQLGELVWEKHIEPQQLENQTLQISGLTGLLAHGIYVLQISDNQRNTIREKLVVQ
jgi:hypothetical protein